MAKIVRRSDVSESDVFGLIGESAERNQKKIEAMDRATVQFVQNVEKEFSNLNTNTLSGINKLFQLSQLVEKQTIKTIELEKQKVKQAQLNEQVKIAEAKAIEAQARATAQSTTESKKSEQQNTRTAKSVKQLTVEEAMLLKERQKQTAYTKAVAAVRSTEVGTLENLAARTTAYELRLSKLTPTQIETTKTGQRYLNSLISVRGELQKQQATYGKHTLNVGNYQSAYNGLGNSISQLAREMPAFANSIQTGFMAISNNLPIFLDEIKRLQDANKVLASQGAPTESVFKKVASGIFSLSTGLSVGVTLLTVFGSQIVEFIGSLFKSDDALDKNAEAIKKNNEQKKFAAAESKRHAEFIGTEGKEMIGYLVQLKNTNKGSVERKNLIRDINGQYGTTLKNLSDEAEFQSMVNKEIGRYLQYLQAKYEIQKNQSAIDMNLRKQDKELQYLRGLGLSQKELNELRKVGFQNLVDINTGQLKYNETLEKSIDMSKLDTSLVGNSIVELAKAEKRLESYGLNLLIASSEMEGFGYKTESTTEKLKEFNTNLADFDVLLANINNYDNEIQLRFDIQMIGREGQLDTISRVFEDFKEGVLSGIDQTGQYVESELFRIVNDEYDLRKKMILEQNRFSKEELKRKLDEERAIRFRDLDAERDDLLSQEGLTADARAKILTDYNKEAELIRNDFLKREELLQLEIQKLDAQTKNELEQNEQSRVEKVEETNQELYNAELKYLEKTEEARKKAQEEADKLEKERLERQQEFRDRLIEKGLEALKKASEEREKIIDKEIEASQKLSQALQDQANAGTITAKESIAEQNAITNERNKAKAEEQRLQRRLEELKLLYAGTQQYVEKGDTIPVARAKAWLEVKGLNLLAGVKGFLGGSKRTIAEEYGAPQRGGRDGYLFWGDGREMMFNPDQTEAVNGATTDQVVQGYLLSQMMGKIMTKGNNSDASTSNDKVVDQLRSVEKAIESKPDLTLTVQKLANDFVEITSTRKTLNQTITSRHIKRMK